MTNKNATACLLEIQQMNKLTFEIETRKETRSSRTKYFNSTDSCF